MIGRRQAKLALNGVLRSLHLVASAFTLDWGYNRQMSEVIPDYQTAADWCYRVYRWLDTHESVDWGSICDDVATYVFPALPLTVLSILLETRDGRQKYACIRSTPTAESTLEWELQTARKFCVQQNVGNKLIKANKRRKQS